MERILHWGVEGHAKRCSNEFGALINLNRMLIIQILTLSPLIHHTERPY